MPLDPDIAADLETLAALGRPALSAIGVEAGRVRAEEDARGRPAGADVAAIDDRSFEGPGGPIRLRVYTPWGNGPFPIVVYVHGGGFVLCSLDTHDTVARNLCAGAGAVVVSVDYRMAPEHPFPAPVDDVVAAVRHVAENAADFGGDGTRIVVGGDSAGGNLAAVAALRLRDEGGPALAGQLLIYPVTDHPDAGHPSYAAFAEGFGLSSDDMRWFFDRYVPDRERREDPSVSPLRAAHLSGLPPAHVMTAEFDVLRDEAEAYAARLCRAGVAVDFVRHAGINHGSINQVGRYASVQPAHDAMVGWLRRIFASK